MREALYESLVRAWPLSRGRTRWAGWMGRICRPGHRLLPVEVGRYSVLVDPADPNDLLYYFHIGGKVFPELLAWIARPGDRVVDVGANVGFFSLCALDRVGPAGQVISFEANPELGRRLRQHFQAQACPIELVEKAVWHEPGELEFFIATNTGWSSAAENPSFDTRERVRVEAVRLDSFLQGRGCTPIRLLKIDVEGAELQVLQGAEGLFTRDEVDCVLFETGGPRRLQAFGSSGDQLAGLMAGHGYRMVATIRDDRLRPPVPAEQIGTFNGDFLYVRSGLRLGPPPGQAT